MSFRLLFIPFSGSQSKGHISQPFFYPFLLICLINFLSNFLLLTIIYQIYMFLSNFLMFFRLLSPFLILVGRNALIFKGIRGGFLEIFGVWELIFSFFTE